MATVYDPRLQVTTLVVPCRNCGQKIYWSLHERSHKRTPYQLDDQGTPTRDMHWAVCPKRRDSARSARKVLA